MFNGNDNLFINDDNNSHDAVCSSGFGCPPGSDVPVCAGLERRLGQHHVPWTGRSGDRPAGKNNTGTNLCYTQNELACGKTCSVCSPSPWFSASWFGSRSQWQKLSSPHASISSFSSFFWGNPRLLRPDGALNLSCCSPRISTQLDPFHNSPTGRNPDQITTPPQSAPKEEYTLFTLILRVVAKKTRGSGGLRFQLAASWIAP